MAIKKQICVMKFGGTSVGDAECFRRAAKIILKSRSQCATVAVVSAMSGITNAILCASERAAGGDQLAGTQLAALLQCRHCSIAYALVSNETERRELQVEIKTLAAAAGSICDEIAELRQPSPRLSDALCGVGEKLATRLVAAALVEAGSPAVAIDATALLVTSDQYGEAEPDLTATRARVRTSLRPLIGAGVVPVITGFIGATPAGIATTLGRGGSDYSATIVAACLDAESVIIWTDVDGVMTADPKLVPDARTIAQLSYCDATTFAQAGAKVIHPKTLRPVVGSGIPVQIRNSFAPEIEGTWVTGSGRTAPAAITGIAARTIGGDSLVTLLGNESALATRGRVVYALAGTGVDYTFGEAAEGACLTISTSDVERCVQVLHREFDLSRERAQNSDLVARAETRLYNTASTACVG